LAAAVTTRSNAGPKPIVLVGFMACGKSTAGPLLAKELKVPFVDTDKQLEEAFGMSITEIFRSKGEASFRDAERTVILNLLKEGRQVIAIGGGAFVDPVTRANLVGSAHTIWLDPPFETIRTRVRRSSKRPMAASRTDEQLRELWTERRASYEKADTHIRILTTDITHTVREILKRLVHH
jgi:shikimate kinase